MNNLELFDFLSNKKAKITNVASVPQRSPFRYPGGKTWLIPVVRQWLKVFDNKKIVLADIFTGGGIVGLTAAFDCLAKQIVMIERDEEVAAAWKTILGPDNNWLAKKIADFELNHQSIYNELNNSSKSTKEIGFCTILKNRIFHGGIIAKGSGMIKSGENGKGLSSRWYPNTLKNRILAIDAIKNKISFVEGDAFEFLEKNINNKEICFFIDPPYTIAGRRLYNYYKIDHRNLFELCAKLKGDFLMTYDATDEVKQLADEFGFPYILLPMKTTHHLQKFELLISKKLDWYSVQ